MVEFAHAISMSCSQADSHNMNEQDTPLRVSCFFPSTRGVVEFIAHDGQSVLLAATGHIRSFIAQRLNESGEPSTKANLAPITAKIIAYPTGSAFESDWIVLERARAVDQDLYIKLNEQNKRSLLVLDHEKNTWRVEDTQGLFASRVNMNTSSVVGPILTHKAARALGEALDDVFELCRYPKELALAPKGNACAYKQMGRCPAACDGSESMDAYRERFAQACQSASQGIGHWKKQTKEQIKHASDAFDFEQAQHLKRDLDQIEKLPTDTLSLARSFDALACICITPSVRKGYAMLWSFGRDGIVPLASVSDWCSEIEPLLDQIDQIDRCASPMSMDQNSLEQTGLDRFALLARHWMTKPSRAKRRRVTVLDLRDQQQGGDLRNKLRKAIADACAPIDLDSPDDQQDEEHTHITR